MTFTSLLDKEATYQSILVQLKLTHETEGFFCNTVSEEKYVQGSDDDVSLDKKNSVYFLPSFFRCSFENSK